MVVYQAVLSLVKKITLELGAGKGCCCDAVLQRAVREKLSNNEMYQQQAERNKGMSVWVSGERKL